MDSETVFGEYLYGKQTYAQLSERYSCSTRTIQRHIDKAKVRREDVHLLSDEEAEAPGRHRAEGVVVTPCRKHEVGLRKRAGHPEHDKFPRRTFLRPEEQAEEPQRAFGEAEEKADRRFF